MAHDLLRLICVLSVWIAFISLFNVISVFYCCFSSIAYNTARSVLGWSLEINKKVCFFNVPAQTLTVSQGWRWPAAQVCVKAKCSDGQPVSCFVSFITSHVSDSCSAVFYRMVTNAFIFNLLVSSEIKWVQYKNLLYKFVFSFSDLVTSKCIKVNFRTLFTT